MKAVMDYSSRALMTSKTTVCISRRDEIVDTEFGVCGACNDCMLAFQAYKKVSSVFMRYSVRSFWTPIVDINSAVYAACCGIVEADW